MKVGVHTSIAGALENAAHHAKKIGCDTFQMFSANPRGWRTLDPTPEKCEVFRATREAHGLSPLVIHDNYLINLASADTLVRERSMAAFRGNSHEHWHSVRIIWSPTRAAPRAPRRRQPSPLVSIHCAGRRQV